MPTFRWTRAGQMTRVVTLTELLPDDERADAAESIQAELDAVMADRIRRVADVASKMRAVDIDLRHDDSYRIAAILVASEDHQLGIMETFVVGLDDGDGAE